MIEETKGFTVSAVDKMATLSKLELSPSQKLTLERELGEIVAYAGKLKKRELGEDILLPDEKTLREDIPLRFDDTDDIVACAKTQDGRFISVPTLKLTEQDKTNEKYFG